MVDAAVTTRIAPPDTRPLAIPLSGGDEAGLVTGAAEPAPARATAPATAPATDLGELIEPGRALALADFAPPSIGAGERLVRLAYRLGISGTALSGTFRKPAKPRLLATVVNPLPGSKMAGTALRAGHFLVHGVKSPIAQVDFAGAARMAPPLERVSIRSAGWPIWKPAPRAKRSPRLPSGSCRLGSTPIPSTPRARARVRRGWSAMPARAL